MEFRKKTAHWDARLTDGRGEMRKFEYVELQCGYRNPSLRFKAPVLDMRIVESHYETWSNGAEVAFQGTEYYAITLGTPSKPFLVESPVGAACLATPKKRKRRVALDSPVKGRKSGGGAEIISK